MEIKVRCAKCGRQTLSYERKKYLDDELKRDGWQKLNDDSYICKHCANNEPATTNIVEWVVLIIALTLLGVAIYYNVLHL